MIKKITLVLIFIMCFTKFAYACEPSTWEKTYIGYDYYEDIIENVSDTKDLTGLELIKSIDVKKNTGLIVESTITWEDEDITNAKYYYVGEFYREELAGSSGTIDVLFYNSDENRTYACYQDEKSKTLSCGRFIDGNYTSTMILDAETLEYESDGEIIAYFDELDGEKVLYTETLRNGLTEQAWYSLKYFIILKYETQSDGWAYSKFEVTSITEKEISQSMFEKSEGVEFLEDVN